MKTIVAALHGILTNQTDPSWPDKLDAWLFHHDPDIKVLKKEYSAGPFPLWNCLIKDPQLARALANELELLLQQSPNDQQEQEPPALWFVAHSNGAVIALLTARLLIEKGYRITGLILTGAALEADIHKNEIYEWYCEDDIGAAIAYSSLDDLVLNGAPAAVPWPVEAASMPSSFLPRLGPWSVVLWSKLRDWFWGKLMWPYGCLGRTGWLCQGQAVQSKQGSPSFNQIFTRWYAGGHSTYFTPGNIESTFEQFHTDITVHTPTLDNEIGLAADATPARF
jgi:pimeloyl-ACP methyl ester carboxylesterase